MNYIAIFLMYHQKFWKQYDLICQFWYSNIQ